MLTSMSRRGNVDGRNDKEWEKSIIDKRGRMKQGVKNMVTAGSITHFYTRKSLDRDDFGINRSSETSCVVDDLQSAL
jgi:hypothetical protein